MDKHFKIISIVFHLRFIYWNIKNLTIKLVLYSFFWLPPIKFI